MTRTGYIPIDDPDVWSGHGDTQHFFQGRRHVFGGGGIHTNKIGFGLPTNLLALVRPVFKTVFKSAKNRAGRHIRKKIIEAVAKHGKTKNNKKSTKAKKAGGGSLASRARMAPRITSRATYKGTPKTSKKKNKTPTLSNGGGDVY